MRKHNPKNERIKRRYFDYLREAKRMDTSSIDMAAAAIASFEHWANYRDFARFNIEQAKGFKAQLAKAVNEKTGKPLAKATIHSRLMALKAFVFWLAGQPGYKSRISYADADYFNPSANDSRIATAHREKRVPTIDRSGWCFQKCRPAATLRNATGRSLHSPCSPVRAMMPLRPFD
ncbi:hypothetical protein [Hoeflea sp.]|uniref:hypothetical protein n=1 Tax=Hoeflea sp. TaxID=1940281 RepID=UPI003B517B2A